MNRSMPGLPVHHQLPESTQTHVHYDNGAIQPSHLLSSPSPPSLNLSQHQGLFKWVSPLHQVAKVLEFQLQHQSLQWTFRTNLLQDGLVGSPFSPRDSQESSPTLKIKALILQCSAFFIVQLSHPYMTTRKTIALTRWTFVGKVISLLFNMLSRAVAKRSCPTSEVRGSGRECQAVMVQERQRGATQVRGQGWRLGGATPHPRSGEAARRSYPMPPHLRPGAAAVRSYPTSKELWQHWHRRA